MMVKVASKEDEIAYQAKSILESAHFPHATKESFYLNAGASNLLEGEDSPPVNRITAVYIIGPHDLDVCKIGVSCDPESRMQNLQTSHWAKLKLHALLWTGHWEAFDIEKTCHRAASELGVKLNGEWVAMDPMEAALTIVKAARYCNAKWETSKQFADRALDAREEMLQKHINDNRARDKAEREEKCRRLGW